MLSDEPAAPFNNGECRLLKLPPELRNYIWELVVLRDQPINMRVGRRIWNADGTPSVCLKQPALAATCKQTRHEVLGMYYSGNSFTITIRADDKHYHDAKTLARYLSAMGPEYCRCLTRVRVIMKFGRKPSACRLVPFVRVFCNGSDCIPRRDALTCEVSLRDSTAHDDDYVAWLTQMLKDLEDFGRQLEHEKRVPEDEWELRRWMSRSLYGLHKEGYKRAAEELLRFEQQLMQQPRTSARQKKRARQERRRLFELSLSG